VTVRSAHFDSSAHHVVLRLNVTGGFLGGLSIEFTDGLNCLIGGIGAGKTTALEFLRFGLGLMPDPKISPQRHRAIDTLVKANLGHGQLKIDLRTKNNMSYTVKRSANESAQVFNENGAAVPISLDRDLIFSADMFSQNEIEEIASNPAAQLVLLDRFQEEEAASIARELEKVGRQLDQSSLDLSRLEEEIDDLRGKASEIVVIEEKLKGLVEVGGPDAEKLNAAHTAKSVRTREEKIPELLLTALAKVAHEIGSSEAEFRASIEAQLDSEIRASENGKLFQEIEGELQEFARILAQAVGNVRAAMEVVAARVRVQASLLAERHALQEAEYRSLLSDSEQRGGREVERSSYQVSLATATSAAKEQQAKEKRRHELTKYRGSLLKTASELRDQRFELRKRVAEKLTKQFQAIRVTIAQSAELQQYRELVAEALKGAGLKHGVVAEQLSQALLPTELSQAVVSRDYNIVMQRTGFDEERARKVVEALRSSGAAYSIESVDLEDRPCIELLDGDKYKESPHLSTGQRCTTILPILLLQSERPLLIDQPEDNLDNAFVYETVVMALRAVKGGRQVIFVTHNPNIPVLGEADRVFVFSSDGHRATLQQSGTVDECKEQIEQILEGGREAFLQRKTRYGH